MWKNWKIKTNNKDTCRIFEEKNGNKTKQFMSHLLTSRKLVIQLGGNPV
jgi:hypothetical protein